MKKHFHKQTEIMVLLAILMVIILGSCRRPVIIITAIPENTPPGSSLYVAGNFNRWDPGDVRFRLQMQPDSSFAFTLPRGYGNIQYKITRGEWSMVETDVCGYDISNRTMQYVSGDTTFLAVLSWKDTPPVDCPELVVVIEKLPVNTPAGDPIALAGSFNDWLPDSSWHLKKDTRSGNYFFNLPKPEFGRSTEFKITRGTLLTSEADAFGYEREKRRVTFGQMDTLLITVENWEDLAAGSDQRLTIILEKIPANTPQDDRIYLTGNFNGWYPRDNKYLFTENEDGFLSISLPKKSDEITFKITRGDWSTEEVDLLGFKMNNRQHSYSGFDTLRIDIAGWLDFTNIRQPEFTIVINQVPENTPPADKLYLAGNINRWNPGQRNMQFSESPNGFYYLTLREIPPAVQFKITRGSWPTEESDEVGNDLPVRNFFFDGSMDTLNISIVSWKDLRNFDQRQLIILLEHVPENTPHDSKIYLAGNFNNWNPENPDYILSKNLRGHYYIAIPTLGENLTFKFTLGGWQHEELDAKGETIPNRIYRPGYVDTLRLKIEKWRGID